MIRRRITMKLIHHKKGEETDNKVKCVQSLTSEVCVFCATAQEEKKEKKNMLSSELDKV